MISLKEVDGGWQLSHDCAGSNMDGVGDGTKIQTIFIAPTDLSSELPLNHSLLSTTQLSSWEIQMLKSFCPSGIPLCCIWSSLSSPKPKAITLVAMHMTCFNSTYNHFMVRLALIMPFACHKRAASQKSKWQPDTLSAMYKSGLYLQTWLIVSQ